MHLCHESQILSKNEIERDFLANNFKPKIIFSIPDFDSNEVLPYTSKSPPNLHVDRGRKNARNVSTHEMPGRRFYLGGRRGT